MSLYSDVVPKLLTYLKISYLGVHKSLWFCRMLDAKVQDLFMDYLEERGINSQLADHVRESLADKEQQEYVSWLHNVKSFLQS